VKFFEKQAECKNAAGRSALTGFKEIIEEDRKFMDTGAIGGP
jgi:hypothetical protein